MEVEELVCVALLARRLCSRRRKRKWLAQPYSNDRMLAGRFSAMFVDLKSSEGKFLEYFRMSIASFDELLHYLRSSLQRENTNMRLSVPPDQRLAVTLRYLATGATFSSLHNEFELGISTVSCIVKDTCQSLWICMKSQCMPALKKEDWPEIEADFRKNTNFPNCIGALDEKHIRTQKPSENRLTIMLIVMADASYRFRSIDVKLDGETNEMSVFKECGLGIKLLLENLQIPEPKGLPDDVNNLKAPFVFVGDEAFNLTPNMLRPYASRGLTTTKKIFNYRLRRARRVVECAIGILTNRWQIFAKPINVSAEFGKDIIKACCILHNFVLRRDGYKFEDTLMINGFEDLLNKSGRGGRVGLAVRDQFAEYFASASGSVPWQNSCISDD